MRRAILTLSVAALGAASFGCALTDYGAFDGATNKSHGVIGCTSSDRVANSQQTVEPATRDLLYTVKDASGDTECAGFNPQVSLENVTRHDARAWNRQLGVWTVFNEGSVAGSGPQTGIWAMAGVKELDDGSVRINNWHGPSAGAFSCVGSVVNGIGSGPEGVIASDGLDLTGGGARIPGWHVETIAIDRSPGSSTTSDCSNIAAVTPKRAAEGYSTYWAAAARGGEGRLEATPVTRREGLADFFAGRSMTVELQGVSITGHAELLESGSVRVHLDGLAAEGASYTAETPVSFEVDPGNNFRTVATHVPNEDELARLARFAIDANLVNRPIDLGGEFVPELGIRLPDASFTLVGGTIERYLDEFERGADDPVFGG